MGPQNLLGANRWVDLRWGDRLGGHVIHFSKTFMEVVVKLEKDRGHLRPVEIGGGPQRLLGPRGSIRITYKDLANACGEVRSRWIDEPSVSRIGVGKNAAGVRRDYG